MHAPPDGRDPFSFARLRAHRARAVAGQGDGDWLRRRCADELADRLGAVNRVFARVLVLGGAAEFRAALAARPDVAAKIGEVIFADVDVRLAAGGVVCDPERLPFGEGCFQLVVSVLHLHWVNDLPGALIQIRRALAPDGLFLGCLFGGETLSQLRAALITGESELRGGAAARVAPFAQTRDLGGLLQRAGFALPVSEADRLTVRYAHPLRLLADLRAMGETSALAGPQPPPLTRAVLAAAVQAYQARFALPDGRVPATFEILTATGWVPHESQQQPLRPGSAKARLADALGVRERSAGEKAG